MPTYKIKDGNRIMTGSKKKGNKRIYEPGEFVTMTDEEAIEHGHALELSDSQPELPQEAVPQKKTK